LGPGTVSGRIAVTHYPSPNFNVRRGGATASLIVIHYTAMDSCDAARARLCDPLVEVSAHWLISGAGVSEALVPEAMRAWHAGAGEWAGLTDINSHSIGVELANTGSQPFPEPQMAALEVLLSAIMQRWSIPPHRVIGHCDMAPERKVDPGVHFDWRRLARQGLAIWPDPLFHSRAEPADIWQDLHSFGYPNAPNDAVLQAFRLRFRPWAKGAVSDQDTALAAGLRRWGRGAHTTGTAITPAITPATAL
jgi:N-acetylmuramoyl-L-alanine amidase